MKLLIPLLSLTSLNAAALTIHQDQGRLEIEMVSMDKPYNVVMTQPQGCPDGTATLEQTEKEITIRHASSCDSGAVVKVQVNLGQDLNAVLGAGALELKKFSKIADQVGKVSASTRVGSARVPSDYDFKKSRSWIVGKAFARNVGSGSTIDLQVRTGSLDITK